MTLYFFIPYIDLRVARKALGIGLFLELFYIVGNYFTTKMANRGEAVEIWPFPTPDIFLQILIVVGLGVVLGTIFSRYWPLPPNKGFERVMRTFLIVSPALGLGIGLQLLLQGVDATQAIYLIFALSAWLGSGHFIQREKE